MSDKPSIPAPEGVEPKVWAEMVKEGRAYDAMPAGEDKRLMAEKLMAKGDSKTHRETLARDLIQTKGRFHRG
jgi:hypothetical protein